jgi:hypothetical protein
VNTTALYMLAIGFFIVGGVAGLTLGVAVMIAAATIDCDTLRN